MKKINKKLLQNDKGIAIEKSKVLWWGKAVSAFKIFRDSIIYIGCGFKLKRRMSKQ